MGDRAGQTCGKHHLQHSCFSRLDNAWRAEFGDEAERPRWAELLRSGVAIFDLDFDAILAAMYALFVNAEGVCYLCVPPDPGIEVAALGASEFALCGTALAEALHTFTLESGASRCFFRDSTTLTPLSAPVPVRLADPSGGPVLARSSTISRATEPPQVAASVQASASGQVAPPCSCRLLSHQTLLWDHRLGHPSVPRLRSMQSHLLVSSNPRSLPPLPPLPASPCLPCVEGRQRAASHSSLPPTTAPLQTLHMDVKGQVVDVLIPWIRTVRLQLRERFRLDLLLLHLLSKRGGEFESTAGSALVAELVDFAAACCLDYATALVAESESASPPSVRGECALGTDVLEDRQEDFACLAAAVPRFASMLLAPEGDPNAPDIPTPRSYAEAITGPYSSQW
ncbi:unnamed protein product [Closterium sp. NIES-54]